tara:strand:+ start:687 stop:983 length:297 start_codon:yes stop_codon:yes gene_type:complete
MIEIESKPSKKDLDPRLPPISWRCKKKLGREKNSKKRKLLVPKKNSEKLWLRRLKRKDNTFYQLLCQRMSKRVLLASQMRCKNLCTSLLILTQLRPPT